MPRRPSLVEVATGEDQPALRATELLARDTDKSAARRFSQTSVRLSLGTPSHRDRLIAGLGKERSIQEASLLKQMGETQVKDQEAPRWAWPKR